MIKKQEDMSAFPHEYENYEEGMLLRDYFAAAALQGISMHVVEHIISSQKSTQDVCDIAAQTSYQIADAMMKARKKS